MKRYRFIVLPLVTAAVVVLTTVFFVFPRVRHITIIKKELVQEKEKLARMTEKALTLEALDEYRLEQKVALVEKALPSSKAVVEILVTLSALAQESEVALVSFSIAPGKLAAEKSEELLFKAEFAGPIDKIENLLAKLSQVLPVMKVLSFTFDGEDAGLEIVSYVSPLPESLGKIDSPLALISPEEERIYQLVSGFRSFEPAEEAAAAPLPVGKEDPFSGF